MPKNTTYDLNIQSMNSSLLTTDIVISETALVMGTLTIITLIVIFKTLIRLKRTDFSKHQAFIDERKRYETHVNRNDQFPDYLGANPSSGWPDDSYTGCRPKTDLDADLYRQYLDIASPDELTKDRMTWGTYRKLHDQNK